MTKINPDYEHLVSLGLPRLEEGYTYKFFIKDYTKYHEGFSTLVDKRMKNALRVRIYASFLGIPFWVWDDAEDADDMRNFYSGLNENVLSKGLASEDDISKRKWLTGHLVIAGLNCHTNWQKNVKAIERDKERKRKIKKAKHSDAVDIAHLLNRKMP